MALVSRTGKKEWQIQKTTKCIFSFTFDHIIETVPQVKKRGRCALCLVEKSTPKENKLWIENRKYYVFTAHLKHAQYTPNAVFVAVSLKKNETSQYSENRIPDNTMEHADKMVPECMFRKKKKKE